MIRTDRNRVCRAFAGVCALIAFSAALACRSPDEGTGNGEQARVYVPDGAAALAVSLRADSARRAARVESTLVIESGTFEPEFRTPVVLSATESGRVAMLDMIGRRVRVYSPAGELQFELEPESDGGGVIQTPLAITTSGEQIVLLQGNTLSYFDADGAHVRNVQLADTMIAGKALPDGSVVGVMWVAHRPDYDLVRLRPGADSDDEADTVRLTLLRRPERRRRAEKLWPSPGFAVGAEAIYVTAAARYEVAAFDLDGRPRWDLAAAGWEPTPIPDNVLQRPVGGQRRAGRRMTANTDGEDTGDWPSVYPALKTLATDGRGRLYVFPFVPDPENATSFPADVYSPDGDLIVQTTLPFQGWSDAVGDDVYRVEIDNGHVTLVRYRITLPVADAPPRARSAQ